MAYSTSNTPGTNARKLTVSCWFKRTLLTESGHSPRIFDYRGWWYILSIF